MSNDELWRSIDDAIVQAPAAMIVVDAPMQLAPVANVVVAVADVVVAVEEGAPQVVAAEEVAQEEVAPEEVAQEEMAPEEIEAEVALVVTEMVVEEVDGAESSGSWREVEEVDVLEPPALDEGAASPVVEIGCARVISLNEYRSRRLEVVEQQSARVATFVSDDGGELAPVIPDKRRVVLSEREAAGSLEQLMSRPSEGKRHREERVEKRSKEERRKKHKEDRKRTKTRRSHSKRLSSVNRAALRAVLFPPRVQLVDCMPLAAPKMLPDISEAPAVADGHPSERVTDVAEATSSTEVADHPTIAGTEGPVASTTISLPRGPACGCICHNQNGSCCPCRCRCSHRDVGCQTD